MKQEYLFKSERLGFRNWIKKDIAPLSKINNDPKVMEYFPSTFNADETANFVYSMQDHFLEHNYCYFAVDLMENNEFIGFIGLKMQTYLKDPKEFVDIGWRLKKKVWGRGLATEGAKACLNYAFEFLNLQCIYSVAPKINKRSIHLMKKIGMNKVRDFDHPKIDKQSPLNECSMYVIYDFQY